jgi:hypothetical protein
MIQKVAIFWYKNGHLTTLVLVTRRQECAMVLVAQMDDIGVDIVGKLLSK